MHCVGSRDMSLAFVTCDVLCTFTGLEFPIDSREALCGLTRFEFGDCEM